MNPAAAYIMEKVGSLQELYDLHRWGGYSISRDVQPRTGFNYILAIDPYIIIIGQWTNYSDSKYVI